MPALLHDSDFTRVNSLDNHPSSPSLADAVVVALQTCSGFNFLPSNYDSIETHLHNASPATVHFSCDDFRMYEFKVRRCMRGRSHDWTECPFAHPGEKARRRDPRRTHYSGAPCPDFRKGSCRRGDACEFAHGVFECWLHPARYRTQVCKDGRNCKRRVCFFAHSPEQLRSLPSSFSSIHTQIEPEDGSPGSPGSLFYPQDFSAEIPSSPVIVASAGSTSKFLTTDTTGMLATCSQNKCINRFPSSGMVIPPPSSNLASSNAFMLHPTHDVGPIAVQLDSLNAGSPLRRAMAQSFLAGKAYGATSFSLNVPHASNAEFSPVFDGYNPLCASPDSHHGNYNSKLREGKFSELNLPLISSENSYGYEPPTNGHGFASPTSTLAGHAFSPPPLSPPLSPLSLSNPTNGHSKGTFTNSGHSLHNFYVDDPIYHRRINETHSTDCIEDLAFRLDHLQVQETFQSVGFPPTPHHESRHEILESMPVRLPHSRLQSLGHVTHGLSCARKQSMWSPMSEISSSGIDLPRQKDLHEIDAKVYGEESLADNLIPDFGWVSELVK